MDFNEGDIIVRYWAASLVEEVFGRVGDWLFIMKTTAKGELEAEYRFRYHVSPGFDVEDEINRYSVPSQPDTPTNREGLRATVNTVLTVIKPGESRSGFAHVREVEVNGDIRKMCALWMDDPRMLVRMLTLEESELAKSGNGRSN